MDSLYHVLCFTITKCHYSAGSVWQAAILYSCIVARILFQVLFQTVHWILSKMHMILITTTLCHLPGNFLHFTWHRCENRKSSKYSFLYLIFDIFVTCNWVDTWWQQCSTVQYSTVQYSAAQHSTAQHSTAKHSTVQYSTVQYSTVHIYTQTIHKKTEITTLVGRLSGIRTQWSN